MMNSTPQLLGDISLAVGTTTSVFRQWFLWPAPSSSRDTPSSERSARRYTSEVPWLWRFSLGQASSSSPWLTIRPAVATIRARYDLLSPLERYFSPRRSWCSSFPGLLVRERSEPAIYWSRSAFWYRPHWMSEGRLVVRRCSTISRASL